MSLEARQLKLVVGGRVLIDDVSCDLAPGEFHVVLGPNGSGKTTLLRLLSGDLAPSAGSLRINGRPLDHWSPRALARQRAVLPQSDHLQFPLQCRDVVALGLLPCPRLSAAAAAEKVSAALARVDASALADRIYTQLSAGERARVRLARALVQVASPLDKESGEELSGCMRLLLLDEPTANLDPAQQHACCAVARAAAAEGIAVLAVLHDLNLAMNYADRVSLMACGRLLAQGTPTAVLQPDRLRAAYGIDVMPVTITGLERPYLAIPPRRM